MKLKSNILFFIAGAFCFLSLSSGSVQAALAFQTEPQYENIDVISLTIKYPSEVSVLKESYWEDLKTLQEQKLKEADLNVSSDKNITHSKTGVEIVVDVELLKVPDANLFAVRIETVMARQMLLATGSDQILIMSIPLVTQGIKFVSEHELSDSIENSVSGHIDQFLRNYQATKSLREKKDAQTGHAAAEVNQPAQAVQQTQVTRDVYVASKNSEVFHKPGCRWAQNISGENRLTYNSRDEAINAGKRPCKSCNP
ncbi:MAG: hypothetical protein JW715_07750 [Sedimentisphaerales bacterium]|nr:hypothetical protein [Sedimentisphaerales bacterium]